MPLATVVSCYQLCCWCKPVRIAGNQTDQSDRHILCFVLRIWVSLTNQVLCAWFLEQKSSIVRVKQSYWHHKNTYVTTTLSETQGKVRKVYFSIYLTVIKLLWLYIQTGESAEHSHACHRSLVGSHRPAQIFITQTGHGGHPARVCCYGLHHDRSSRG